MLRWIRSFRAKRLAERRWRMYSPMILDMRMRASTSCCVHMRRLPRSSKPIWPITRPSHTMSHWRSEEMAPSRMNVFPFREDFRKIAAIIDAAEVPCLGQLDGFDGDVLEPFPAAPFRIGAPFVRDAGGLPVGRIVKDEDLVHAQGVFR